MVGVYTLLVLLTSVLYVYMPLASIRVKLLSMVGAYGAQMTLHLIVWLNAYRLGKS